MEYSQTERKLSAKWHLIKADKEVDCANGFGFSGTSTLQKDGMDGEVFDSSPMRCVNY